jgi:tRNA/rRNA methyltransferase
MSQLHKNIQIVLVRAENPINIGQAARAMKNFGLSRLALVRCAPHQVEEAYTPGWKARKILDNASTFPAFKDAVGGSSLVVGFTNRGGKRRGEGRSVIDVLPQIVELAAHQQISLVFGNEKNGLSNEELNVCHEIATIPASKEYTSLNLSHAVAVVSFLIFSQTEDARLLKKKPEHYYGTPAEFEKLMEDFRTTLLSLGYQSPAGEGPLESTLGHIRRFFSRGSLDKRELHLFEAFLSRVQARLNSKKIK